MLCSENPRYKGRIYVGFTVDPSRRIVQHNRGSKFGGAARTSNRGPWEMMLIVSGFPNDISALRFEWAWQNPGRSRRLAWVPKKKSKESSLMYHLRLLGVMISCAPWVRLPLTVNVLNAEIEDKIKEALVNLPSHMRISQGLPSSSGGECVGPDSISAECGICGASEIGAIREGEHPGSCHGSLVKCYQDGCKFIAHLTCLAGHFLKNATHHLIPIEGDCPTCGCRLNWGKLAKCLA
ncbi:Hypothetical Protein NTJ_02764 [Nesidiocoris tenuis]|uniref:GIY-YIG domain-containing protein n=1 Tax=Nesidiocoris tenuis TaxID=355587 RepID=A0ABN7AFE2_9HEMI|nr:Hypothetical Protein NTJ_02764 [Nesidiocoris tenuis]